MTRIALVFALAASFAWAQVGTIPAASAGGGAPTGPCGGDLNGTMPNCGVAKINGTAFSGTANNIVKFGASNIPVDSTIYLWPSSGNYNLMIGAAKGGITAGGTSTASGTNNICLQAQGLSCFYSLTSGSSNIAIGQAALWSVTTGTGNVAIGNDLGQISTGSNNIAIGPGASSGGSATAFADGIAIGRNAASNNTTSEIVAVGLQALAANTTGNVNTALGAQALQFNTTGSTNVAVGPDAMQFQTTASDNVAVGARALASAANGSGGQNVGIGNGAGYTTTIANANVTGSDNTWVGYNTGPGDPTQYTFQTVIGANATGTCSSCIVLGRSTDAPVAPGAVATPASSSAACTAGQFAFDASFHYDCVATNTWHRVASATW